MKNNQCWVYLDSGECVDVATVDEAIAILAPRYSGRVLTSENVVSEAVELALLLQLQEEPNGDFYSDRYGDW